MSQGNVFSKVVIGIDPDGGARDAIGAARTVAPDAELVLATVYPHVSAPGDPQHEANGIALRDEALRMVGRKRLAAGLDDAHIVAIAGMSPAKALKALAADERADLLVIGPGRESTVGRLLLGDTCAGVLRGSGCPVLVAPVGTGPVPSVVAAIGVAYDHSPESEHALALAVRIAQETGARITILSVIDVGVATWGTQLTEYVDGLIGPAQARLDAIADALPVPATAEVLQGSVAKILHGLAVRSDLVVCGSRGWGPAGRVAFGSAAERLTHGARCPVLVAPRGAERPSGGEPSGAGTRTETAGTAQSAAPVSG